MMTWWSIQPMKRNFCIRFLALVILTVSVVYPATAGIYFVATNGSDANAGTSNAPFATIQKAAGLAAAGDQVWIRSGVYRETVTPASSGTAASPITFQAFPGERAVISGCDLVTSWLVYSNNIWKATVATNIDGGAGDTFFVNGQLQFEARWPNNPDPMNRFGWALINNIDSAGTYLQANDLAAAGFPTNYWKGAKIRNHFNNWTLRTDTIASFDGTLGKVTFATPYGSVNYGYQGQWHYYFFGTLKALDAAGEWFHDVTNNVFYYQMNPGQNPNTNLMEFKTRAFGFNISSRSYLQIKGIEFRGCSISTDTGTEYSLIQSNHFIGFDWDNFGRFFLNGDHNVFRDNEVDHTFTGISLNGSYQQVVNNYFHDTGYNGGDNGTLLMGGSQQLIAFNTFTNFGRNVSQTTPQQSVISYNYFIDGGNLTYDTGDIEWNDGSGTTIHHNVIGPNSNAGYPFAAFYGGGNQVNLVFHHNIIYNPGTAAEIFATPNSFVQRVNNTYYGLPPTESGGGVDYQTVFLNNIVTNLTSISGLDVDMRGNHNYVAGDFANAAAADFRLTAGSGAIDSGVIVPGITDGYSGTAPDAGALEYGQSMWQAGCNFTNPPYPVYDWQLLPLMNNIPNASFLSALSGWIYVGTPVRFSGNSWNFLGYGLSSGSAYSVQLMPGEGMYQTFTGLQSNTWYYLGALARMVGTNCYCTSYSAESGTIGTSNYRNETGVTGLDAGEWLRFDNVNFGAGTPLYDRMDLAYLNGNTTNTLQVRLDAANGTLLGTFTYGYTGNASWYTATISIPAVTGTHSVYLVAAGGPAGSLNLDVIRLLKSKVLSNEELIMGANSFGSSESGLEVDTLIGGADWPGAPSTIAFKTGPTATSANVFYQNNGIFQAYLDGISLYQGPAEPGNAALSGTATQSSTGSGAAANAVDGIVLGGTPSATANLSNSWWQVDLGANQAIDQIHITNPQSNPTQLSNFRVSVWSDDPSLGGVERWGRSYFTNGSLPVGATFIIRADEVGDTTSVALGNLYGRVVRIQLNGKNNAGNGILSLAEVKVIAGDSANFAPATGVATQSSTTGNAAAALAIDGNRDGNPADGSVSQTTNQSNSWWQVLFVRGFTPGEIKIYNRSDASSVWLGNFHVSVWSADPSAGCVELWGQDYYPTGSVAASGVLRLVGGSIAKDGSTRLGSVFGYVVRVQLNGLNNAGNGILSLAEVEVRNSTSIPTSENAAWGGVATQSSNHYFGAGYASLAIDGNVDPFFNDGSVTHIETQNQPWWQVNFGQPTVLDQIVLVNRYEVSTRLSNFRVSLFNGDPNSGGTEVWRESFYTSGGSPAPGGSVVINNTSTSELSGAAQLKNITNANFLRVQLNGANYLSLAEVLAWKPSVANPDINGNGLPDWWEDLYFGSPTAAVASADSDGNGMSNLQKYIAGIDPTNPAATFKIQSFSAGGGTRAFGWNPVAGRQYDVYYASQLTGAFSLMQSNLTFTQNTFTDSVHSATSEGYYRLKVHLP